MFETTTTTETEANQIPREFKIANPLPPYTPTELPPLDEFPKDVFIDYNTFISQILPNFELDPNVHESSAFQAVKSAFEKKESNSGLIHELFIRQYLLACHKILIKTMNQSHPSLTKLSLLHHELYQTSLVIKENNVKQELSDYCDMMMAETVDAYHNSFSDTIETHFWAKTKTVEDLIHSFLHKEFEKIRSLNPYTYKQLTCVALHKAIDSAPNSSVNTLLQWIKDQNLSLN